MIKGFLFLVKYTWKFNKIYLVYILFFQMITSLMPLLAVVLPKFIIDELLGEQRTNRIVLYIAILVGYNLIGGLLSRFLQGRCFTSKGAVFAKFQTMLANMLANCDFEQLERPDFLDLKEQAGKFLYANGQGFGVVLDSAINIIGKLFVFVGLVVILARMSIWVVLLFIVLVLLNSFVESKVRNNYVKWDMEKAPIERKTAYFVNLVQDFSYGKEIRMYHLKDWLVSKIEAHLQLSHEFYIKQTKSYDKSSYFSTVTAFIRESVSYGYLALQMLKGMITFGDFTMYLGAISQFSAAMNDVMQSVLNIKQFGTYYNAVEKYMNVPATMREGEQLPLNYSTYEFEFRDVWFRYHEDQEYVLKNINIQIHHLKKLSIVGENGAGKTTFVKLLCRLYDPTKGQILLNGIDIRRYDYDAYMAILSAVFQDSKLFSFTVKENIAFEKASIEKDTVVEDILNRSGFSPSLQNLHKGIHSNIYRNFELDGFEPSGGETQKISLAKALYKNTPIVILDEPTAALDPRAEFEIYQKFNELVQQKTAIYISHRLSSTRFCDHVAVFINGEIVEYGNHDTLLGQKGIYAELFEMQARYYQ